MEAPPKTACQYCSLPNEQARATAFCDEVKQSPSCLQLCLTRFGSSPYIEVKFWCLQTLHEVGLQSTLCCGMQLRSASQLALRSACVPCTGAAEAGSRA